MTLASSDILSENVMLADDLYAGCDFWIYTRW